MKKVVRPDVLLCDTADLVPPDKRGLFACHDNQIWLVRGDGRHERIEWAKLKRDFQQGALSAADMKAVGDLRKNAIAAMLRAETRSPCYNAAGSTDLTSDLDFTYMTFVTPKNTVMTSLLNFYARFYAQFGNFSDVTFDTNFYITNTIMSTQCFAQVTSPRIQKLFTPLAPGLVAAWFQPSAPPGWQALDDDLAYIGIQENTGNVEAHASAAARLPDMLRFGCALFEALEAADAELAALSPEQLLLLVRLLIVLGSVNSNEKYISAYTTAFIVYRVPLPTPRARCLAYLDNLVYLLEWRAAAGGRTDAEAYLTFFDAGSKYLGRLLACLRSPGGPQLRAPPAAAFVTLCELGQEWRDTVRGKLPIASPQGQGVLARLAAIGCNSVQGIMALVDAATAQVRAEFGAPREAATALYAAAKRTVRAAVGVDDKGRGQLEVRVDKPALLQALAAVGTQAQQDVLLRLSGGGGAWFGLRAVH